MFETIRNLDSSFPLASNRGKYFWFCRNGENQAFLRNFKERFVEFADVDARVLDQRRDLSSRGLMLAQARVLLLRFGLQLPVDFRFSLLEVGKHLAFVEQLLLVFLRASSTISAAPMKRWPRVRFPIPIRELFGTTREP